MAWLLGKLEVEVKISACALLSLCNNFFVYERIPDDFVLKHVYCYLAIPHNSNSSWAIKSWKQKCSLTFWLICNSGSFFRSLSQNSRASKLELFQNSTKKIQNSTIFLTQNSILRKICHHSMPELNIYLIDWEKTQENMKTQWKSQKYPETQGSFGLKTQEKHQNSRFRKIH